MRFLVLGAGRMGRAIAYDLIRAEGSEKVVLAERDRPMLDEALAVVDSDGVEGRILDLADEKTLRTWIAEADAVVSAVPYDHNAMLAECCVEGKSHFCDLGGNNDVVARELALDERAEAAGVSIIPDCGLAPGMVSLLSMAGCEGFDSVDWVRMRVGGLPAHPVPPLNYMVVFSPHGLINEYIEPCIALREGRIVTVEPMAELEELEFPAPYGRLEAFTTSGGASTMPASMQGRAKNLDYKTIRYPGHCAMVRSWMQLGLTSSEAVRVGTVDVSPRELLETCIGRSLGFQDHDVILCRVSVEGQRGGKSHRRSYEMIDVFDERTGLSAMARTTGFPAATVAWMMARGEVLARGAKSQEASLPAGAFIEHLRARGLSIVEKEEAI